MNNLVQIWSYRGFIKTGVAREFQKQNSGAALGIVWSFLMPALTVTVYTVIFSTVLSPYGEVADSALDYGSYIVSGLLAWLLLSDVTITLLPFYRNIRELTRRVAIPKLCFVVIYCMRTYLSFLIFLCSYVAYQLFFGQGLSLYMLNVIPLSLLVYAMVGSFVLLLAALTVFIPDIEKAVSVFLQFGFWLSPIVYPIEILPSWIRAIVEMNPITYLVSSFRDALMLEQSLILPSYSFCFFLMLTIFLSGLVNKKLAPAISDM